MTAGPGGIKPSILPFQPQPRLPLMLMAITRTGSTGTAHSSVALGAAKEFYDSRPGGTGWSVKDFVWDIAGAVAGYSVYQSLK